jgi:HlyD family secretion protein
MLRKKRNIVFIAIAGVLLLVLLLVFGKEMIGYKDYIVIRGEFESAIVSKGEIKSQDYQKVILPEPMRDINLNIYYLKINDLVPEGSIVEKGDYVALLDQERIKSELQRTSEKLESYENEYVIRKIDSTSSLTNLRNSIKEKEYDLEYKEIEIKQSVYESPSYQDKVKRSYSRAVRELEVGRRNYQRKVMQYSGICGRSERQVASYSERKKKLTKALSAARITSPIDGMVIYATVHGRTRKKGDQVSLWSPEILVLPDLTKLVSESYVEEINIAKVAEGDRVRVSVDALPDKVFMGEIIKIANIGKSLKGVDSKVFDISVKIDGTNDDIAHGMYTTNEIITHYDSTALIVSLDCVFNDKTGSYVYKREDGEIVKVPIKLSHTNDELGVVESGIKERDVILAERPMKEDVVIIETNE